MSWALIQILVRAFIFIPPLQCKLCFRPAGVYWLYFIFLAYHNFPDYLSLRFCLYVTIMQILTRIHILHSICIHLHRFSKTLSALNPLCTRSCHQAVPFEHKRPSYTRHSAESRSHDGFVSLAPLSPGSGPHPDNCTPARTAQRVLRVCPERRLHPLTAPPPGTTRVAS